jgi:hypothetical protein
VLELVDPVAQDGDPGDDGEQGPGPDRERNREMVDRVDRRADQIEPDAGEREAQPDPPAEPPGRERDRDRVEESDPDLRGGADADPE